MEVRHEEPLRPVKCATQMLCEAIVTHKSNYLDIFKHAILFHQVLLMQFRKIKTIGGKNLSQDVKALHSFSIWYSFVFHVIQTSRTVTDL